jgi:hypothetical protein
VLSSATHVANDVDQYAMSFRPSNTEHTIAGRGPFAATVIRIDLHRLLPQRGQISHASVAHGHPTTRRQGIVFGGSPKATASNICLLNIRRMPRQSTSSRAHVPRSPCPGRRRIGPEQPLSTHLRHQARLPECPVPNARQAPLDDLDGRVAAVHWRRGEGPIPSTQPLGAVPLTPIRAKSGRAGTPGAFSRHTGAVPLGGAWSNYAAAPEPPRPICPGHIVTVE